jgi:hypothetical protein
MGLQSVRDRSENLFMRRLRIVSLIACTAVLAVAGCSSSDSSSSKASSSGSGSESKGGSTTDAGSSGETSAASSCDLVSSADIATTLGLSVGDPEVTDNDPVTVCTYPAADGGTSQVLVRFQTGMSQSDLAASRTQFEDTEQPTADVTGIGEVAFSSTIGSGSVQTNTIETVQGGTDLLITAGAPLAGIETLAKQVLQKL